MFTQRKKKQKIQAAEKNNQEQATSELSNPLSVLDLPTHPEEKSDMDTFLTSLSSGEKGLVEKMYIATLQGKHIDIDSINKILGVGRKETSVQKTRRSTSISKINESFAICLKQKNPLIIRHRDDDDKRSYTYQIAEEHMDVIGKYMA